MSSEAYIYEAIRTPRGRGKANGSLHGVKPVTLVTGLIDELRTRHPDMDPNAIDDLVLGCVTPVGDQGADIARTAAIFAGLPDTVGGTQLNRFCASALEAVNIAAQKVRAGWDNLVIAGGVESHEPSADGLRRRRVGDGPRDRVRHLLRAAGHQRRPDRHHRGLHPR